MKSHSLAYLGSNPVRCAQMVSEACGFGELPICEETVIAHLGIDIEIVPRDLIPEGESGHEILDNVCAWLHRKPDAKVTLSPSRIGDGTGLQIALRF